MIHRQSWRTRLKALASVVLSLGAGSIALAAADFERDVAPLLIKNCLRCHNASDAVGGLDLTDRGRAIAGGESGAASIVPGKADESYLLDRVRDGEMPPAGKGQPLSQEQIDVLQSWIEAGAPWPAGRKLSPFEFTTTERAGRDWWALKPPVRPQIPQIGQVAAGQRADWVRTPIDAFILAQLGQHGLEPSPEADRLTLIRRATFDLWGLPPSPEEVAAFLADSSPDAYDKLVDRLLASSHYGEQWGQHWLDVVRFAESNGYETNGARTNAWPYRDYVIDAINRDIPYSQFIREQLSGEQCGAGVATGYLVAGAHDVVGSPDVELTRQQRHNDLDDMVSTTSQVFMALTAGCAKCHDHKFDPISQRDYYGLQGLFSGVFHGDRDVAPALDEQQKRQHETQQAELASMDARIRALVAHSEPLAQVQRPAGAATRRPPVHPLGNIDRFAPVDAKFVRFSILTTNLAEPCIDELEIFEADTGRNVALALLGAKVTASGVYAGGSYPIHQIAHAIDGQFGNSRSWISSELGSGWIQIELSKSTRIDRIEWARDRAGTYSDRLPTGYRIDVAQQSGEWQTVATGEDRAPFSPQQARSEVSGSDGALTATEQSELARLRSQAEELRSRLRSSEVRKVYAGTFNTPQPILRLHRGEVMQPREEIPPATPALVGPPVSVPPGGSDAERRAALAAWLTDPAHPLTSRVMVNRIWYYHFGRGLVRTPSDFGFNGGRPSHPELLDYLATEFMAHAWSAKYLHRLIMLSSVYRQSSRLSKQAAVDGDNEFLWRFRPHRLEAEAVHDSILSVAGVLDSKSGGPGYEVFLPDASNVKVYEPKPTLGPAEWRRMVYQNKPRMRTDPTFGVFDCPDASQSVARRNVSTTALQSLNLLNSSYMLDQSQLFAQRLTAEHPGDIDAQIARAFQLGFTRSADAQELAAARQVIAEQGLVQLCRAIFNANEFVYIR